MYIQRDIQLKNSINIVIGKKIAKKLQEKHRVVQLEIIQCFQNHTGKYLQDDREQHKTYPLTQWFIAETNAKRRLKIVFIRYRLNQYVIKTAYEPNIDEEKIYQVYGQRGSKL